MDYNKYDPVDLRMQMKNPATGIPLLSHRYPQWIPAGSGKSHPFLTISNLPLTHQNQTAARMILNTVRAYLFSAVLHFPRNICHHRPIPGKYIPHTVQDPTPLEPRKKKRN